MPGYALPAARDARSAPAGASALQVAELRLADALDAARDWAGAFVGEAGQREKANGRTADVITIVSKCEALANEARPDR